MGSCRKADLWPWRSCVIKLEVALLEVAGWKKSSTERHILIILGQLLIIEAPAKHQQHLGKSRKLNGDRYWTVFESTEATTLLIKAYSLNHTLRSTR
ncbi:Ribosomal RNA small subunit methyltransferase [Trichinella pseudospiralis]